ncbi:MAG: ATP synthase subunit I [Eubacteriales bacterium]
MEHIDSQNKQLRNLIINYQLILVCSISLLSFFAFKFGIAFTYGLILGTIAVIINLLLLSFSTEKTIARRDNRILNSTIMGYPARITIFGIAFCISLTIGTSAAFGTIATQIIYLFALFLATATIKR